MALKNPFLALAALLCALAALCPAGSRAEEEAAGDDPFGERDASSLWLPGLGITSTGFVMERRANVESVERGRFLGDSRAVVWSMGVDADVLSPSMEFVPMAPRAFVHGGASISFDREDPVANDDDPGTPEITEVGTRTPVSGVKNLGSATKVETRALSWTAGAGLAFEFQVDDLRFRVKPSVEWLWQRDRVRSQLSDAQSVGGDPAECNPCRLLRIDATTNEKFHSVGPGLEIEVDGARLSEHVVMTVFGAIQALTVVGRGDKSTLSSTGTWMTNGMPSGIPDSTVNSEYERDRWSYRFGVGVRFRWFPE
jgi:hypothetical protein